jgi:xylan 1,4-beta-xylosidase
MKGSSMITESGTTATGTQVIRNPVLTGFHPDPSILRVGTDYYLATSTFEWFPGVRVHHSRDLVNWRPIGGILTEGRLLDLDGVPDSGGVWAPCLSYADGWFYLVFTVVANFSGGWWDTPNYVTRARDIAGPWETPIAVHARGFDPTLFHDVDGSTWLAAMTADWRPGRSAFAGVNLQRYLPETGELVGECVTIFTGTDAGFTEGPHLYRIGDWYYLMTAEGGTGWNHQVTLARSRSITGPYEPDPNGPMLTSRHDPSLRLQKAGHGSLVSTPDGEWFLAHLTARPNRPIGECMLGRETAIQRVTWTEDGWARVPGGVPADEVDGPRLPAHPWPRTGSAVLDADWSTLRRPATPDWIVATAPDRVRITGGQSPLGRRRPSLAARRVGAYRCSLEVTVTADPAGFQQLAGVTAYYNGRNFHYAYVSRDGDGLVLDVMTCDDGVRTIHGGRTPLSSPTVRLRVEIDGDRVRFAADDGTGWTVLADGLDATILSDEHATTDRNGEPDTWGFTGAFLGLWAHDFTATGWSAEFAEPVYAEADHS